MHGSAGVVGVWGRWGVAVHRPSCCVSCGRDLCLVQGFDCPGGCVTVACRFPLQILRGAWTPVFVLAFDASLLVTHSHRALWGHSGTGGERAPMRSSFSCATWHLSAVSWQMLHLREHVLQHEKGPHEPVVGKGLREPEPPPGLSLPCRLNWRLPSAGVINHPYLVVS